MSSPAYFTDAVQLLKQLIATPSLSKEEDKTADVLVAFFADKGLSTNRHLNNVWLANNHFDAAKPTILLNSHHDTVKPNSQYSRNPFSPDVVDGKLYGLGSSDAGGCMVSLIATFLHFYSQPHLKYNLAIALTAEEEISGANGIEALLPFLPKIDFAIVGEPTQMNLAVAEKALMVIDAVAKGKAGHAARQEGENALYKAIQDIQWLNNYRFPKVSEWLGEVLMTTTVIETDNKAHNVVPSSCRFVVDVRITDEYSHEEILEALKAHCKSELIPRSMRIRASGIDVKHPIVRAGLELGKSCYGSPTTSDMALMNFPALKCGPGDSARSHTADEFILLGEIENGIRDYIEMLNRVILIKTANEALVKE